MECEDHVRRVVEISSQLLGLANTDRPECEHDGCLLLDGIVRDCAMKICNEALRWQRELDSEQHTGNLVHQ